MGQCLGSCLTSSTANEEAGATTDEKTHLTNATESPHIDSVTSSEIRCICLAKMVEMNSQEAYPELRNGRSIQCDCCTTRIRGIMFHCPHERSKSEHPLGYDICQNCASQSLGGPIEVKCDCGMLLEHEQYTRRFSCSTCRNSVISVWKCPRDKDVEHVDGIRLCEVCAFNRLELMNNMHVSEPPTDPTLSFLANLPADLQISIADWASVSCRTFVACLALNKPFARVLSIERSPYTTRLNRLWERMCRAKYPHISLPIRLRRWDKMLRYRQGKLTRGEVAIENCTFGLEEETVDAEGLPEGYEWTFRCPMKFYDLKSTGSTSTRYCDQCKRNVYLVRTTSELKDRVDAGSCVAVSFNRRCSSESLGFYYSGGISASHFEM